MRRTVIVVAVVVASLTIGTVAPVDAAPPYKEETIEQVGTNAFLRTITLQDPTKPPAGVNDFSCTPSAEHPDPVVLIHGTGGNRYTNWGFLGPHLANAGYCVFALNYGGLTPTTVFQGTDAFSTWDGLATSAAEIEAFIDQVRAATGAPKVDLIGHSQGALLSLYVTKLGNAAPKVRRVVTIGSPTQGSTIYGLTTFADALGLNQLLRTFYANGCTPCASPPIPGSLLMEWLHTGGIAIPGIAYTMIMTRNDRLITPPENGFIPIDQQVPEAQGEITNIMVQDVCPADAVGHTGLAYDKNVSQMIRNALDPAHAAPVVCGPSGPQS